MRSNQRVSGWQKAIGVFALLGLIAGCGEDSDRAQTVVPNDATQQTDAVESQVQKRLTQAQVDQALLSVDDLPDGFRSVASREDAQSDGSSGCEALEKLSEFGSDAEVRGEVSFRSWAGARRSINESIAVVDNAKSEFSEVVKAFSQCPKFEGQTSSGVSVPITTGPLDAPMLGDETFAVKLTAKATTGTVVVDYVIMRAEDNMVIVSNSGLGSTKRETTIAVATAAMEKLNQAG